MKKIIIIVIASLVLNNCGYTPIYSSKEKNFYIEKISQKKTSKLNSKIANNLKTSKFLENKDISRVIYIKNKLINLIIK